MLEILHLERIIIWSTIILLLPQTQLLMVIDHDIIYTVVQRLRYVLYKLWLLSVNHHTSGFDQLYLPKEMFFLIPIPLLPQDTVDIRNCDDTIMHSSDTITFDPFSITMLIIVAFAARPLPLRLPSWSWMRSSIPVIYSELYHSWMLEPLVVQVKIIFMDG